MITLAALAELADRYPEALRHPVVLLRIGDREWQDEPVLMETC